MWIEDGHFYRESHLPEMRFAFTNYGVSIGLQAADAMLERVERLHAYVEHTGLATSTTGPPSPT